MSILVIAEHDNKTLNGATLNVVAAAQKSVVILLYWLQALVLRLLQKRQQNCGCQQSSSCRQRCV